MAIYIKGCLSLASNNARGGLRHNTGIDIIRHNPETKKIQEKEIMILDMSTLVQIQLGPKI
jgi:hypothetical protein